MATITPAVIQGGAVLGTAVIPIYTTPASTKGIIRRAVFTNVGAAAVTYTVSILRVGAPSAVVLISARSLAPNQSDVPPELASMVLGAGDVVSGSASLAASVNAFMNGYTVV